MLKSLEQNICHAEAFESALQDPNLMAGASDAASAWLSTYHRQKNMSQANKGNVRANTYLNHNNSDAKPSHQACTACGSHQHSTSGTGSHQLECPAWRQTCSNCGKPNHLSRVCWVRKPPQAVRKSPGANEATMGMLIAQIAFSQATGTYTPKVTGQIREIDTYIVPFLPKPDPRQARDIPSSCSTKMTIFPDSGATICFRGLQHILNMGLTINNLIPSRNVVRAVGDFTLMCQGSLPVEFILHGKTTKQALYICQKIQHLYFSKAA